MRLSSNWPSSPVISPVDYTKKNADTGKVTNYGKNVQFYYTFAQGAQVAKAVENGDLEKGWTSNIEQTSMMS